MWVMAMTEIENGNLAIWNKLAKTDPAHVKRFKRPGGFEGHAIRPIYSLQRMTEMFGPCGDGWRVDHPEFQTITANGEILVYCVVSVRVGDGDPVWGVGGDFVLKETKYGLKGDDEAFKKAFTDAVANALKHLGMSADVHQGMFDSNKYVAELRRELAGNPEQPKPARNGNGSLDKYATDAKALAADYRDKIKAAIADGDIGALEAIENAVAQDIRLSEKQVPWLKSMAFEGKQQLENAA